MTVQDERGRRDLHIPVAGLHWLWIFLPAIGWENIPEKMDRIGHRMRPDPDSVRIACGPHRYNIYHLFANHPARQSPVRAP